MRLALIALLSTALAARLAAQNQLFDGQCAADPKSLPARAAVACPARGEMAITRPRFALFGDSLTQRSFDEGGWGAQLVSTYQRKADVTLRGYSGYNTRWALQTLDANFPASLGPSAFQLATVWFGANDAALPDGFNKRQHVPLAEYKRNLGAIVQRLQALGATVVVVTPPPVDEAARLKLALECGQPAATARPERTLAASGQYAAAAREVAAERKAHVLDLHARLQRLPAWQALLSDGLHFNPKGSGAVFAELISLLRAELPHLREEALLPDFPLNTDIDSDAHEACFAKHAAARAAHAQ